MGDHAMGEEEHDTKPEMRAAPSVDLADEPNVASLDHVANEQHASSPDHVADEQHAPSPDHFADKPHVTPSAEAEDELHTPVTEQVSDHATEPLESGFDSRADTTLGHELRTEVADTTERDFVARAAEAAEHDARLASDAPPFVAEDPDAHHGPAEATPAESLNETFAETPHDTQRERDEEAAAESFSHDAAHEHAKHDKVERSTVEPFGHSPRQAFGHEEAVLDIEPRTRHYGPTIHTDPWLAPADTRTEPALNLTAPAISAAATAGPAFIPLADDDRNDFRIRVEPHPEPRDAELHPARRILGWIVAVLLLVLLITLLAWWQREPVMSRWPQTVDVYQQACAKLGCAALPPRNIDQLQIEASTLTQSTQANRFELSMNLHNRAALALAWPALEISLLDANNQLVIRRVVSPAEYLPAGIDLNAGIGANARQAVRLQLTANGAAPANYRVLIFYP
ncbi:DUF3426 domain-containing protein [Pararobbsia alpina]|uniref:DUF3426 domain-containing protein n=1 Tax=Pararobbsia alpina TaxID=621374 RepID=A0A6S7ATJ9_9BURK|nr:DUF3426 domain-containing protein [Pararobbsia alpina]CAB3777440.1 hypothetical protein LMG28138_00381 [Pararobbsia alpina]